jgi:hypothetical protein
VSSVIRERETTARRVVKRWAWGKTLGFLDGGYGRIETAFFVTTGSVGGPGAVMRLAKEAGLFGLGAVRLPIGPAEVGGSRWSA